MTDLTNKPRVNLTSVDSNVFNLLGICSTALRRNGQQADAEEMNNRVFNSESYEEALAIMLEYVDPTLDD